MISAVCTLFENHYHYGVGALVNSLYQNGFRGVIWAGYRGSLPIWAKNLIPHENYHEFSVAEGCSIRFVPLVTNRHLTNYKPVFMVDLWQHYCPEAENLFYFDPDITIKCRWSFFEEWVGCGIALSQDVSSYMPANHPKRFAWKRYAENKNYPVLNQVNQYFNGGLVGVSRNHISALVAWQDLLQGLEDDGVNLIDFMPGDPTKPFYVPDQDTLNILPMILVDPFSTLGPEGMDFVPGGTTMSHALGSPKPWRKNMVLKALRGVAPTAADKGYWRNVKSPIPLYSAYDKMLNQVSLRIGAAIGRFIRST